jgi:hypothetical protein
MKKIVSPAQSLSVTSGGARSMCRGEQRAVHLYTRVLSLLAAR